METITAKQAGYILCRTCSKLCYEKPVLDDERAVCPRCYTTLSHRIHNSLVLTWTFTVMGILLLIPANVYPIMTVIYLGRGNPDTIMSGVIHLMQAGMYPIAILVFVASIAVPVMKLAGILFLLIMVQLNWKLSLRQCTVMYRFIKLIGRWSMLDLFMISILVTLVDLGAIATVTAGVGATAFASVVVVTMFAAMSFDSRLIWDLSE